MKRIVDSSSRTPSTSTTIGSTTQRSIRPFSGTSNLSPSIPPTIRNNTNTSSEETTQTNTTNNTNSNTSVVALNEPSTSLFGLFPNTNNHEDITTSSSAIHIHSQVLEEEEGNSNLTVPSLLSLSNNTMHSSFSSSGGSPSILTTTAATTTTTTTTTTRLTSPSVLTVQLPSSDNNTLSSSSTLLQPSSSSSENVGTSRSRSRDESRSSLSSPPVSPLMKRGRGGSHTSESGGVGSGPTNPIDKEKEKLKERALRRKEMCMELGKSARKENDAMVYLDGPRIYTCGECRTHLTSHDEIISKSFHGRHGRAYLFDNCVNISIGKAEDRRLITGLHSVCDIFCKRCKTLIGWTYAKAYEPSQKYKEGKFIIEKIHLHMEESGCYEIHHPAGEKRDRWRIRSMSWSSESSLHASPRSRSNTIYEYRSRAQSCTSTKSRSQSSVVSTEGMSSLGSPVLSPFARPPSPPSL